MASDIGLVATAVAEIAKVVGNWQVSAEKKKLQGAIEAGEKYIQTNEDSSLTDARRVKLLKHYKKRFFALN